MCYIKKATEAWNCQGGKKTKNTNNQPNFCQLAPRTDHNLITVAKKKKVHCTVLTRVHCTVARVHCIVMSCIFCCELHFRLGPVLGLFGFAE